MANLYKRNFRKRQLEDRVARGDSKKVPLTGAERNRLYRERKKRKRDYHFYIPVVTKLMVELYFCSPFTFLACCLIKHRDNFAFIISVGTWIML
jgi:hypothetical protein